MVLHRVVPLCPTCALRTVLFASGRTPGSVGLIPVTRAFRIPDLLERTTGFAQRNLIPFLNTGYPHVNQNIDPI